MTRNPLARLPIRLLAHLPWRVLAAATLLAQLMLGCDEAQDAAAVAMVNSWTQAGLKSDGFADKKIDALGKDATCKQGKVNNIETTVCQFPNAEAARAAQKPALATVGEVTGMAITSGNLLLVVADRDKTDPSGKAISEIASVFHKSAPREKVPEAKDTKGDQAGGTEQTETKDDSKGDQPAAKDTDTKGAKSGS